MSLFRYWPYVCVLACGTAAVFLVHPSLFSRLLSSSSDEVSPTASPEAEEALQQALNNLDPARIVWLETDIRQNVHTSSFSFQTEGRYHLGPDGCSRLELKTTVGGRHGSLLVISDGRTRWQAVGEGAPDDPGRVWSIRRVNLREVRVPTGEDDRENESRRVTLFGPAGPLPLLRCLQQDAIWTRVERVMRSGREWLKLTGRLKEGQEKPFLLAGTVNECRLYLDPRTYWPERVEWWGVVNEGKEAVRLVEMEFRNPVLNRVIAGEEYARLFGFDPGTNKVKDITEEVKAQLEGREVGAEERR